MAYISNFKDGLDALEAEYNKLENLQLLHKDCHFEITSSIFENTGELSTARVVR